MNKSIIIFYFFLLSIFNCLLPVDTIAQQKITFPSLDGLEITADVYYKDANLPLILLFHQARFSRAEYKDIAKQLNDLGFNCIAIDLRAGARIFGIVNETNKKALQEKHETEYLDAEQDMVAATDYAHKKYRQKVILWGSSFSASLALKVAKNNDKVKAVVAFSPGEYFGDKLNLKSKIKGMSKPVFVTSSKEESQEVTVLISELKNVTQFIPLQDGTHGSKALWKESNGNEEYWESVKKFLEWKEVKTN